MSPQADACDAPEIYSPDCEWRPLKLRAEWDLFSNGAAPSGSAEQLGLDQDLLNAIQTAAPSLASLLEWSWDDAVGTFGMDRATELVDCIVTLANEAGCCSRTKPLPQSIDEDTLLRRWSRISIAHCRLSQRTQCLLEAEGVVDFRSLIAALAPLHPALCFDCEAFINVWARLCQLGLAAGNGREEWLSRVRSRASSELREAVIASARAACSGQYWSVIALRYGLAPLPMEIDGRRYTGGRYRHTLSDVGKALHRTRERIRQIEVKALARLRASEPSIVASIMRRLVQCAGDAGGILSVESASEALSEILHDDAKYVEQLVCLFLDASREIHSISGARAYRLASVAPGLFEQVANAAKAQYWRTLSHPGYDELVRETTRSLQSAGLPVCESLVKQCLRSGLRLADIPVRTYADWLVAAALRSIGKPAHYLEIAGVIDAITAPASWTTVAALRARLQVRRALFVCTSPGVYGLVEWGMVDRRPPATLYGGSSTAGVIMKFFVQRNEPASPEEVVAYVTARTCYLWARVLRKLVRDPMFHRIDTGQYIPTAWLNLPAYSSQRETNPPAQPPDGCSRRDAAQP